MASAKTQPARGMRDFLPEEVRKREYVIGVIKEVYERFGFEPLETPAVENIETLLGKYGEEGNQLIFKILKRGEHEKTGEADLALRYDLTVPLARVVAEHRDKLPKFFKRYQIQPVWRADRPARGRFREFYQCDVDVLGSRSMVVEAEICSAVTDILTKLGFEHFMIHLNHRQLLASLLDEVGIPTKQHSSAITALDKLDKIGAEGVKKEFAERQLPVSASEQILDLFSRIDHYAVDVFDLGGDSKQFWTQEEFRKWNEFTLSEVAKLIGGRESGQIALKELKDVLKLSTSTSAGSKLVITPNLARGLSYYTGAIMEINVPSLPGSLGGGGRYDNLVGMFLGEDVPACGFSLGLERIIVVMTEREMFPAALAVSPADILVASLGEEFFPEALSLAEELRKVGMRVSMYPDGAKKPQKPLSYADAQKIPIAVLIGEDEHAKGIVTVRNLVERGQERPVRQIAVEVIQAMLAAARRTQDIDQRKQEESATITKDLLRDHEDSA